MQHQDWNNITFNNIKDQQNKKNYDKTISQKKSNNDFELKPPPSLSKNIIQARNAKGLKQSELSKIAGISNTILQRWESGKEFPNNQQISTLEKILGIKLPRLTKVKKDTQT
tara:strand:+ start:23 stop:358 length:336 start_codon:yes stop_codon:yes gene_type:complete